MEYTTEFTGAFDIRPPLTKEQAAYIEQFSGTRRMQRDAIKCAEMPDPKRIAVGLPVGIEGEFFVGGQGYAGQDRDPSVLDGNEPPRLQPGLWCHWIPADDGSKLLWDQSEKFYYYVEWLHYMTKNFFTPWGRTLAGRVDYQGEEENDKGYIQIIDGEATRYETK